MSPKQVTKVFQPLHEYRDAMQTAVGAVEERDLTLPYGDPLDDHKEMTIASRALGAAATMAGRRSALLKLDSAARGMQSHEIRSVVAHLSSINPAFRPLDVLDVENELDRQVRELEKTAEHVHRRLT